MLYCTNSHFSILINGRLKGEILALRGIRQGDLLSSFLFTIVANSLNQFIKGRKRKGFLEGFKIGKD